MKVPPWSWMLSLTMSLSTIQNPGEGERDRGQRNTMTRIPSEDRHVGTRTTALSRKGG